MSKIVSADNQGIDLLSVASNSCALLEGLGWGRGGGVRGIVGVATFRNLENDVFSRESQRQTWKKKI